MPLFSLSTMARCNCTPGRCSAGACAHWNWPCTVKPTLSLQTELAGAGTKQVAQRAIQRYISQPVLRKWLFYGYRIQDRGGCPRSPHLSVPLLDRLFTADQHKGAAPPLPFLRMEGVYFLPLHQAERAVRPSGIWEHPAPHCLAQGTVSCCSRQGDPRSPKLSCSYIYWPPWSISSLFGEVVGDHRHS